MKLKPIVASMFLLGLVSGTAFAATTTTTTTTTTQTQLDAMKAKIAKMEAVLDQNQGGTGLRTSSDWASKIAVSGLIDVDAIYSNRTPGNRTNDLGVTTFSRYNDQQSSDLNLGNAFLFVDSQINDWTKAHAALDLTYDHEFGIENRSSLVLRDAHGPLLDEAYIKIANFTESPFYAKLGRQYIPFGDYDIYAVVPTLTQLLSESRKTAATVGMVDPSGFNGSLYTFRGINRVNRGPEGQNTSTRIENFGVNLGFANAIDNMGYKLGIGYLDNMADVNYIANTSLGSHTFGSAAGYTDRVNAISVNAGMNNGPFDASINYVAALKSFNKADLYFKNPNDDAKPWAAAVNVGYSFPIVNNHPSRVSLGYQQSGEAANIGVIGGGLATGGMPEKRYQLDYKFEVSPNTDVTFVLLHDRDYDKSDSGTDDNATTGVVRFGVKFS